MTALFDNQPAAPARPDGPDRETVQRLESLGFSRDKVRQWSQAKASAVLTCRLKELAVSENLAAARAAREDEKAGEVGRGRASLPERVTAGQAIREAVQVSADETVVVLAYTLYALGDEELNAVAGYVMGRLLDTEGRE